MSQFYAYNSDVSMYIEFVPKSTRRYIDINKCLSYIGENIAMALPFFHAFSGADATTSFYRKSKANIFTNWMKSSNFDEITTAFQMLSWLPSNDTIMNECLPVLKSFICEIYGESNMHDLNLWWKLFKHSSSNNMRELPPTYESHLLQILRACFQAGWNVVHTLATLAGQ